MAHLGCACRILCLAAAWNLCSTCHWSRRLSQTGLKHLQRQDVLRRVFLHPGKAFSAVEGLTSAKHGSCFYESTVLLSLLSLFCKACPKARDMSCQLADHSNQTGSWSVSMADLRCGAQFLMARVVIND